MSTHLKKSSRRRNNQKLLQGSTHHFDQYCKRIIHRTTHHIFNEGNKKLQKAIQKIKPADGVMPGSREEIAEVRTITPHQVIRCLLHFHNRSMRAIIEAYVNLCEETISDSDTFNTLLKSLQYEANDPKIKKKTNIWDRPVIRALATDPTIQQNLHITLKSLKWDVILMEWCSEWKNPLHEWVYRHGPLYYLSANNLLGQTRSFEDAQGKKIHFTLTGDLEPKLCNGDKHKLIQLSWKESLSGVIFRESSTDIGTTKLKGKDLSDFQERVKHHKQERLKQWREIQAKYIKKHKNVLYRFGNPYIVEIHTNAGYCPNGRPSSGEEGSSQYESYDSDVAAEERARQAEEIREAEEKAKAEREEALAKQHDKNYQNPQNWDEEGPPSDEDGDPYDDYDENAFGGRG
jgi:hypothetical protein